MRFDDFDTQITCEESYTGPEWPEDDDPNEGELWPDLEEEPDMDDEPLQDAHGLTADGYALLAEMDAMGAFI